MGDADGKIDPSSPFYLGSGDQPGNIITHIVLRGDNYLAWSRAITLALKSRRKFVFIDGTITKPTEKKKFLDWDTVNSMLISWILRSMEPNISATIPYFEEAKKLWDYLSKRFCISNGPRLQQLRAAITECKQTTRMSVEAYYTALMSLYDDLNRLKPLHGCSCGLCTCGVAEKFEVDREEEKLHQFLIGIDDDLYGIVRSNLLSRDPLPTIDEAYLAFTQDERSKGVAKGKADRDAVPVHAFAIGAARPPARLDRPDRSKLWCSNCKVNGHDSQSCFKIHGFPEWWEEHRTRKAKAAAASSTGRASSTAASGRARNSPVRANAILEPADVVAAAAGDYGGGTTAPSSLATLNNEQVQQLLNLLNDQKLDRMTGEFSNFSSWIIDAGASHHVTGNESCLTDIVCIPPCPVALPNGHRTMAVKSGRVVLSDKITLHNVLVVPALLYNLLSVSQLN